MMRLQPSNERRLHELLAARAVERLTVEESLELDELVAIYGPVDARSYEELAALLDPVFDDIEFEPLPEHLRARLAQDAAAWLESSAGTDRT